MREGMDQADPEGEWSEGVMSWWGIPPILPSSLSISCFRAISGPRLSFVSQSNITISIRRLLLCMASAIREVIRITSDSIVDELIGNRMILTAVFTPSD